MNGSEKMKAYRAANPDYVARDTARKTARSAAMRELARRHPAEFMALYEAELKAAEVDGLPSMKRPCACGGVIRRKAPTGQWPRKCGKCLAQERARQRRAAP